LRRFVKRNCATCCPVVICISAIVHKTTEKPKSMAPLPRCLLALTCYATHMTKLLDDAMEAARNLPADTQDSIAHVILRLAGTDDEAPVPLSPGERSAIATSKAAATRGEFATDEQVRAVWAKHNL
jgi:hypothetical protein